MKNTDLKKLVNYIEANIRSNDISGMDFIDPRDYITRLRNKQNHVIFGRRGSGKTTLIKSLDKYNDIILVKLNIEDFKGISFPNSLIHILRTFFKELKSKMKLRLEWYQLLKHYTVNTKILKIERLVDNLERQLQEPDLFERKEVDSFETSSSSNGGMILGKGNLSANQAKKEQQEKSRNITVDKLEKVKNEIPMFIELIKEIHLIVGKPIFLILDDFYFISKQNQPFFIDFFHRISKNTQVYLKICTIRHRSKLYVEAKGSYYGMEVSHDAQEVDLDYNLDRFQELKNFMNQLIASCARKVEIQFNMNDLFTGGGYIQLCLASGGVPRDFLSLFNKAVEKFRYGKEDTRISKINVTEIAIENFNNKRESFKKDSLEEKELLEKYLNKIKDFVLNKEKKNIFLVENNGLEKNNFAKQIIRELVDLRMIHLVDNNTSAAPSDGKMYSAYMIDIGLYNSTKQQKDFKQVQPDQKDEKGRSDEIRSSPRLNLDDFRPAVDEILILS